MEVPLGRRFLPLGSPASAGLFYSRPLSSLSERQRWKQPAFCPSLNGKTARLRRGILPSTHLAREGRMTVTIGRRELLVALGGAAAARPLAARAAIQKAHSPRFLRADPQQLAGNRSIRGLPYATRGPRVSQRSKCDNRLHKCRQSARSFRCRSGFDALAKRTSATDCLLPFR